MLEHDREYFTNYGPDYHDRVFWLGHFSRVASMIVQTFNPVVTLDVGCAFGYLVECLRALNVRAYGCDTSEYAISQVHPALREFVWCGSPTIYVAQDYDLITMIEVTEHLEESDARHLIKWACSHTTRILFSSTPYDLSEPRHVCVRPHWFWEAIFSQFGFRQTDYNVSVVTSHAVVFERRSQ